MGGWAEGSLILLLATSWFLFISIWNMALIMDYEGFLNMPMWKRTLPWGISMTYSLYFVFGIIAWIIKSNTSMTRQDSFEDIVFAFILWLSAPTFLISTTYAVNMFIHTDDLEANVSTDLVSSGFAL